MPRKKIKDNPELEKDITSQAVINTNSSAFEARRAQMAVRNSQKEELDSMKKDIEEIKELLKSIAKGK